MGETWRGRADQAWIESLNGHTEVGYQHRLAIEDPATPRAELAAVREHDTPPCLHVGISSVTPEDEHDGRAEAICKAREDRPRTASHENYAPVRMIHTHPQLSRVLQVKVVNQS